MANRIIKCSIYSLVFAIFISSFFSTTVFAKTYYETEDNDNISKANKIEVNLTVNGQSDRYDVDYFIFSIPSDGYVSVEVNKDYGEELVYALIEYDGSSEKDICYEHFYSNSERSNIGNIGINSGTYYFYVRNNYSTLVNYNFTISYYNSGNWETLNNGNVTKAKSIKTGQKYYGSSYGSYPDKDYYKFSINKASYVQVSLSHEYNVDSHDVLLNTYDLTKEETIGSFTVGYSSNSNSSEKIRLEQGTYFICVSGRGSNNAQYNFIVNTVSGDSKPTTTKAAPTTTTKKNTENTKKNDITKEVITSSGDTKQTSIKSQEKEITKKYEEYSKSTNNNDVFQDEQFKYINDKRWGGIVIVLYIGSANEVVIPKEINGVIVVGISDGAFVGKGVVRIDVPDGVIYFGTDVFDPDTEIVCSPDSPAYQYAQDNNLNVEDVEQTSAHGLNSKTLSVIIIVAAATVILIALIWVIYFIVKSKKEKPINEDY